MAGVTQFSKVPVVLACQNNLFVVIQESLLMKESTVFSAELSSIWHNKHNTNTGEDNSGVNIIQPKVIPITKYGAEAIKIVIEWVKGYDLLSACKDIQTLTDAILFLDFYDIQRPMQSFVTQLEFQKINANTLIAALAAVAKLEQLEIGNTVATNLEASCTEFAISNLNSANLVGKFVTDNCDNIDLVMRLLLKCEGQFTNPKDVTLPIIAKPCLHKKGFIKNDKQSARL